MVACFRQGYVVLPCTEQLRAKDLRLRLDVARPAAVVADRRNADVLAEAGWDGPTIWARASWTAGAARDAAARRRARAAGPVPDHLHERDRRRAEGGLHGQRYLAGQQLQAEHWLAARPGDLVWCTAASGWSKSARNVFIAPWLRGAAALLHDARFDPAERLDILDRERVAVLCMAPTEYRVIAKRARCAASPSCAALVAAGEALNPEVLEVWRRGDRPGDPRRLRPDRDRPADRQPRRRAGARRARWAGRCRGCKLWIEDGELVADPATVPTFFLRYMGEDAPDHAAALAHRRPREPKTTTATCSSKAAPTTSSSRPATGSGRSRSSPRWSPTPPSPRPPSSRHPTRSAAASSARSSSCATAMRPAKSSPARCRTTSRPQTAPYKYPRIVEFADELPKTSSGKVRRALLRGE